MRSQRRKDFLISFFKNCLRLEKEHTQYNQLTLVNPSSDSDSDNKYKDFLKIRFFHKNIGRITQSDAITTHCKALNELKLELQRFCFEQQPAHQQRCFSESEVTFYTLKHNHSSSIYTCIDDMITTDDHIVLAIHKDLAHGILHQLYEQPVSTSKKETLEIESRYDIEPSHLKSLPSYEFYRMSVEPEYLEQALSCSSKRKYKDVSTQTESFIKKRKIDDDSAHNKTIKPGM
jgi:hypothetical protein